MSLKLIDTEWSAYDSNAGKTLCRGILLCDTVADLPGVDDITGYRLTQGSKARVIGTASKYMMQSDGTWSVQEVANDMYTKSEIDTMLASYLTKQEAFDIDENYKILASDDLDQIVSSGNYYVADGATAATLQNCPTVLPFRLEVRTLNATNRLIQRVIDGNPSTPTPHEYIRVYTAGGWSAWNQVTLTPV